MICNNCHKAINSSSIVCPYCGKTVSHQAELNTEDLEKAKEDRLEFRKKNLKNGAFKSFLAGFLIFLFLIGAGAFAMYYTYTYFMGSSSEEYINSISEVNDKLININKDVSKILENNSKNFPVNDLLAKMPSTYDNIDNLIKDLNNITAPSMYSAAHKKLKETVELNETIYHQLEKILKSPTDSNIQSEFNTLSQYIEQCFSQYNSLNIKKNTFTLPNEIVLLPSKLSPWIKQKQQEYSEVSSLMDSFSKYFENMSSILLSYDSTRIDLSHTLKKAREDNSSWDELLSLIDKNEKTLSDVKVSYLKISVPSYIKTFNTRFGAILDNTFVYYEKMRLAIQAERSLKTKNLSPEQLKKEASNIEAMYEEADKINSSRITDYQKFTYDIEEEKNKYLNLDYVINLKNAK